MTSIADALLPPEQFFKTKLGTIYLGDSLDVLADHVEPHSVDLIMTSPPFGLVRKKEYGNVDADQYVEWFRPFGALFKQVLKENGSLVIDIGGAWISGQPTRSLYHFKLLIMLCEEFGFHLAQEFYWWNPSKLPTPAEWVTVRRIRVKDAIDCVWWLSPSPWPRASNRRVLQPYSPSMRELLRNGYHRRKRPSGHDISAKFSVDNGAAIPPNLIALPNTESNSYYLRYCRERGIEPHPARYPAELPEYFIRMLSDPGDLVVDPFAGSCVTGEVSERLDRRWICAELGEEYLRGALARFDRSSDEQSQTPGGSTDDESNYYRLPRPGVLWNGPDETSLPRDGGRKRSTTNGKVDRDTLAGDKSSELEMCELSGDSAAPLPATANSPDNPN
ncbi:MAG TPA: site-specific DNA-methyltransferase [Chloroflexota bacterium]|nr:site-specific DNA-methyltransferase [Chloroflexota bacterium]